MFDFARDLTILECMKIEKNRNGPVKKYKL